MQDGLLYASYWNDGLVILDVGNGIKGGSPSNPQLVSQFKYDLNDALPAGRGRPAARASSAARTPRGATRTTSSSPTRCSPPSGVKGAKDAAAGRAYGRLQVIDVSDIEKPKSVAWYEPEYGGVHNVWVAGDTLYMGAYNAGFRDVRHLGRAARRPARAGARDGARAHRPTWTATCRTPR